MLSLQKKINFRRQTDKSKRHVTAQLEKVARASWVSYPILLQVCSKMIGKEVKDIGQLTVHQLRKVQKEVKEKGWKLR